MTIACVGQEAEPVLLHQVATLQGALTKSTKTKC